MALTFPYPLEFFFDRLPIKSGGPILQRFDEQSGSGDGRVWTAEMSPPLWSATFSLADQRTAVARDIEARIGGLDGSRGSFLFADPSYSDPAGGVAGDLSGVTVRNIRGADRGALGLSGLPPGQKVTVSDYLSIAYAGGRIYFGQFIEDGTANASGEIALREVRPYLPMGVTVGAAIELARPFLKGFIPPNGYRPYELDLPHGEIARGGSITILQRP